MSFSNLFVLTIVLEHTTTAFHRREIKFADDDNERYSIVDARLEGTIPSSKTPTSGRQRCSLSDITLSFLVPRARRVIGEDETPYLVCISSTSCFLLYFLLPRFSKWREEVLAHMTGVSGWKHVRIKEIPSRPTCVYVCVYCTYFTIVECIELAMAVHKRCN